MTKTHVTGLLLLLHSSLFTRVPVTDGGILTAKITVITTAVIVAFLWPVRRRLDSIVSFVVIYEPPWTNRSKTAGGCKLAGRWLQWCTCFPA